MWTDNPTDRRQTARIPTGAKLLHRAVGMSDYALCDVRNITTSGIELLLDRPWDRGTVMTVLVRPEGASHKYYRVVGAVDRREPVGSRWLHVIKASSKRPWSPMFIYDVMYQALAGLAARPESEPMYVEDASQAGLEAENSYAEMVQDLEATAARDQGGHPDEGVAAANAADADELEDAGDAGDPDRSDASPGTGDPVVYSALAWFAPFDELNALLRQFIAREQTVTRKPAGAVLIERGSDDDVSLYLVRPHAYTVRAVTDVTVIVLSQELVRRVARITATHRSRLGVIEVSEQESPPAEITRL